MSRLLRHWSTGLDPVNLARVGLGMECDPWQSKLLRPPHHPRVLVVASRQAGKSLLCSISAVDKALHTPGSTILVVSPTQRQSIELLFTMQGLYRALGKPVAPSSENQLSLTLENFSRIIALPGDNPDALRGYSKVDLIIVDEASRVDDSMMAALRPMLAISSGRLLLASSPNGRRGFFWEYSEGNEFRVTTITAEQCPRILPEFLAAERKALGSRAFEQEYMCSFSDTSDQWLSSEKVDRMFAHAADTAPRAGVLTLPVRAVAPPVQRPPVRCLRTPDGRHAFRAGVCMACMLAKEA